MGRAGWRFPASVSPPAAAHSVAGDRWVGAGPAPGCLPAVNQASDLSPKPASLRRVNIFGTLETGGTRKARG